MAVNPLIGQSDLPPEGKEDPEKYRFQVELEFVQCLANPQYLNFLAQRGYFKEQEFINYLEYLQYWKKQEYAQYLKYPQCLHFLDLLQTEHFRRELANAQCTKFIEEQQLLHWHYYTKRRMQFQEKIRLAQTCPQLTEIERMQLSIDWVKLEHIIHNEIQL